MNPSTLCVCIFISKRFVQKLRLIFVTLRCFPLHCLQFHNNSAMFIALLMST